MPVKHDFIEYFSKSKVDIFSKSSQLYSAGRSLREIQELTGIPKTTIRETLIAGGISLRPAPNASDYKRKRKFGKQAGHPPYGYCFLEGQLEKNPFEYKTLLKIMRLWNQGHSANSIAKIINSQGLKTRHEKSWRSLGVKRIIKREIKQTKEKERV